jgi:hypothetical protein
MITAIIILVLILLGVIGIALVVADNTAKLQAFIDTSKLEVAAMQEKLDGLLYHARAKAAARSFSIRSKPSATGTLSSPPTDPRSV